MVPKASGGWRPRGEFRCLNEDATADRYPIPHIQDFTNHLAGTKFFSKIDLVHGYHQIPMRSEDVPKTAVITPFGLFEFLRMPFGLKNGAQAFQRLMDTVSRGLDFIFNYLDYILVASRMWQEHCVHLCLLCQHLSEHSLVVNPSKCQFSLWAIDFLGHHEIRHGEVPPPDRVEAIRQFPQPSTVRGLQEFIGMVTFYHRFIPRRLRSCGRCSNCCLASGGRSIGTQSPWQRSKGQRMPWLGRSCWCTREQTPPQLLP